MGDQGTGRCRAHRLAERRKADSERGENVARARAELVGVHVRPADGLSRSGTELLDAHRVLLGELGGRYAEVSGNDIATALVSFAKAENATQLLLGATQRSRIVELVQGSVINQVIRAADGIDVHVLSGGDSEPTPSRLPRLPERGQLARLPLRRRLGGWLLALIGIPALGAVLVSLRADMASSAGLPELLAAVVIVACVGGALPAAVAAIVAFSIADWYLIPPIHSFTIGSGGNVGALLAFLVVAGLVSLIIDRLARRTLLTARAKAESEALARLAGAAVMAGRAGTSELVTDIRNTFGVDGVVVLARSENDEPDVAGEQRRSSGRPGLSKGPQWRVVAASGEVLPSRPEDGAFSAELAEGAMLVIGGSSVSADDRRLLGVFVAQLKMVQAQQRLSEAADSATSLAESNELRTALLAAVSHDLRTPLASIKASATSLLSDEVVWGPQDQRSFYETIDEEADRLDALVDNLLDMSRLQTGALKLTLRPVGLEEVVFAALASISGDTSAVTVDVAETLQPILTDPALLERAVANLVSNALAFAPGRTVHIVASVEAPDPGVPNPAKRIELRIVDRGPGIPLDQRDAVFRPFQRLGDGGSANSDGVGLGLAVARGFVEAIDGRLTLDDTPGGGLTASLSLPVGPTPPSMHPPVVTDDDDDGTAGESGPAPEPRPAGAQDPAGVQDPAVATRIGGMR